MIGWPNFPFGNMTNHPLHLVSTAPPCGLLGNKPHDHSFVWVVDNFLSIQATCAEFILSMFMFKSNLGTTYYTKKPVLFF